MREGEAMTVLLGWFIGSFVLGLIVGPMLQGRTL